MSQVNLWDTLSADYARFVNWPQRLAQETEWRMARTAESGGCLVINVRRVYDKEREGEGVRFLVDRLWPRGVSKRSLGHHDWLREVAPSHELRRWFRHDPDKWDEFQRRYAAELDEKEGLWQPILEAAKQGDVALLYAARDTERNNAVALKQYLEKKLSDQSQA